MEPAEIPEKGRFSRADAMDYITQLASDYWQSLLSFVGAIVAGAVVVLALAFVGIVDLSFMNRNWGTFAQPVLTALLLTNASFFLGFFGAMPVGLVRAYGPGILRRRGRAAEATSTPDGGTEAPRRPRRVLKKVAVAPAYGFCTGYVEGIRGTPFYVQMFIVYYFVLFTWPKLPQVFLWTALLGLTINTLGYQAEVLRGGFQAVGQGQIEAAKAMGLRGRQIFAWVTFPQAIRLVFLPMTNEWIGLFKATSILTFFSIVEPMFQAFELGSSLGHPIEAFVMVSVVYLVIIVPVSRVLTYLEVRRRIPGLGTPTTLAPRRGGRAFRG